jgi:hypothetical protein
MADEIIIETTSSELLEVGTPGPQGPKGDTGDVGTTDYNELTNVPATFPPSAHAHVAEDVTDFNTAAAAAAPVQSVNGNTGSVTVAVPAASTGTPQALGLASAGTSDDYSRADHIHPLAGLPVELIIACSDETTSLTTGTAKVTFRAPYAFTLTAVRASVNTAPTGSTLIVDINEAGTTVLSTKLSIDASEKTSTTAASAAVISDSAIADDAEITIDIDQIGSTIAGKGLKVALIGTRA